MHSAMKTKSHIPYAVFLAISFLAIGVIFAAVGGGFAISNHSFLKTALESSATVVEIREHGSGDDTDCEVTVLFTTRDGRVVRTQLREYAASMEVGSVISVFYDPVDPADARYMVPIQILSWVFLGLGAAFLAAGLMPMAWVLRSKRIHRRLREEGRRLYARIDRYQVNTSVQVFSRHPVVLILSAQVGPQTLEFRCRNFFKDPQQLIGKYASVYYNPEKLSQYAVEVSVEQ